MFFTSRVVRSSKVTNSRQDGISDAERLHLAKSMNHSLSTADSYYDHGGTKSSVLKTICTEAKERTKRKLQHSELNIGENEEVDISNLPFVSTPISNNFNRKLSKFENKDANVNKLESFMNANCTPSCSGLTLFNKRSCQTDIDISSSVASHNVSVSENTNMPEIITLHKSTNVAESANVAESLFLDNSRCMDKSLSMDNTRSVDEIENVS